jgi:hypothetical protein
MKMTRLRLCLGRLGAYEWWLMSNLTRKIINRKSLRRLCKYIIVRNIWIFFNNYQRTFPLELSKIPKFNLTAENFPKTTHQDKEWSI